VLLVHRRQFVLGPEPFAAHEDWISRRLGHDLWLSCCPELRVELATDAMGGPWALLGHAVETREDLADPAARIAATATAAVPGLLDGWMGRWVLLGADQVQMDASARLGILFGAAADGRCWVSSSPALLAGVLWPEGPPAPDARPLRYEVGIPWVPPPRSRYPGIRRLLASQALDPRSGVVAPRRLMPPIDTGRDDAQIIAEIARGLVTGLRRLGALSDRPLQLGLSAGRDSRLVLAMALRAGADVACFTRIAPRTPLGDRVVPPLLAARAGFPHTALTGRRRAADIGDLVERHSAGHLSAGDGQPLALGTRDALEGISIGGWGPIGNRFHYYPTLPLEVRDARVGARAILRTFAEPTGTSAERALSEYLEWVLATPEARLDWRDRFHIEQGLGGLIASKEQLYDVNRLVRFPIYNSALNHALMLSLTTGYRHARLHQEDLIRLVAPELMELPVNPPDRHFGVRRAVGRRVRYPMVTVRRARSSAIRRWRRLTARRGG
jgi:hypothetical protein